ncbi:FIG00918622: hypothetical protein [hydrothermal vent metagenome]|uniref:Uncharacterized protein n=1 Tax=hydrothermal vent metagenome TaxID=652676 RepID=A0A3B0RUU0_9ZZZZ
MAPQSSTPPSTVQYATRHYFQAVDAAFDALDQIFETEGIWVKKHNLIYEVVNLHLGHLRWAFECWKKNVWFLDKFNIDLLDSGMPAYQHVLQIENDRARIEERLAELPETGQIKNEMAELMLKYKQFPAALQKTMGERMYFDALDKGPSFRPFTAPVTVKHSFNPRSKRPFYVVHWAVYDGRQNIPVVYMAVIEDSSPEAPRPVPKKTGPWGDVGGDTMLGDGLPNKQISDAFTAFVKDNSQYSLTLTTIATAMDKDFPTLHPKQLRRFVLGPLYIGGVTSHHKRVETILSGVSNPQDNWLLNWTLQELLSKQEISSKHGLWGKAVSKEIYHIDTSNLDAAKNGVSSQEKHALVPHEAFQKAYATGVAENIFDGYQLYVASGDHIIRHV